MPGAPPFPGGPEIGPAEACRSVTVWCNSTSVRLGVFVHLACDSACREQQQAASPLSELSLKRSRNLSQLRYTHPQQWRGRRSAQRSRLQWRPVQPRQRRRRPHLPPGRSGLFRQDAQSELRITSDVKVPAHADPVNSCMRRLVMTCDMSVAASRPGD